MPEATARIEHRSMSETLALEPFRALTEELASYTEGDVAPEASSPGAPGGVLPFVRGLRLSARLIYIIRERLCGSGIEVDWGHLVDAEKNILSNECDIILHRGSFRRWNGNTKPVMDFHFVNVGNAIAVISCKTTIRTIDSPYAHQIKPFVKKVCLFGQCCHSQDAKRLAKSARSAGYTGMWYLYSQEKDGDRVPADKSILNFLGFLDKIKMEQAAK